METNPDTRMGKSKKETRGRLEQKAEEIKNRQPVNVSTHSGPNFYISQAMQAKQL